MSATHPAAVWLNVARSSARTAATRRRLYRQFEYLDLLDRPTVIGLTDVHTSSIGVWADWAKARGYQVVTGRLIDRLPTTALLLTDADVTVARSQRVASTPRRTARGLAGWLEMQSELLDLGCPEPVRVGNAACRTSHRTALNYFRSCVGTGRFVVGGDFDLAHAGADADKAQREEIRWIAAHTPFVEVAPTDRNGARRVVETWRAGSAVARTRNHVFADAATAAHLRVGVRDVADADGPLSDYRAMVVEEIVSAGAFDAVPPRRFAPASHASPVPRPCVR